MSEILPSIWWLLVALGVLVTFHELGHYWAARWCGVKVLRFSVGFGKPVWMRKDRHGTEWAIAWIPLGGYVRMLGEHDLADRKTPISEAELGESHDHKPVGQRMLISFAGPFANFILCIALLWLVFVIGRPDYAPVVGKADGIAAMAGVAAGDTLLAVGERETPTWTEASVALATASIDRIRVPVRVRTATGIETVRTFDFTSQPADDDLKRKLGRIGILARHQLAPEAVVGDVTEGGVAWGKLETGDRILAIGGTPVSRWADISAQVERIGRLGGGLVEIDRNGVRQSLTLVPRYVDDPEKTGTKRWLLNIGQPTAKKDVVLRYGPLDAVPAAFRETRYQLGELFSMFQRAFSGRLAAKDTVSGPIGIAKAANQYAREGLTWYLGLLALLSLSLAVLNLLPIPVLDGGHLLYYLIELVKGSPLSDRAMAAGQYVGVVLLLGLMSLAFFNDLQRLFQ